MNRTHTLPHGTIANQGLSTHITTTKEHDSMATEPKIHPNFIDMIEDMISTEEGQLLAIKTANQLTSQLVFSLDQHVRAEAKRVPTEIPTIDDRNEHVEGADVEDELKREHTEEIGFTPPLKPYEIAEICEAVRVHLYELVEERDSSLPMAKDILYTGIPDLKFKFTSAEGTLRNRAENSKAPSEARKQEIKANARKFGASEDAVLAEELRTRNRFAAEAIERIPAVLQEIKSLDVMPDGNAWMRLPREMQESIVLRVRNNIAVAAAADGRLRTKLATLPANSDLANKFKSDLATYELAQYALDDWIAEHCETSKQVKAQLDQLEKRLQDARARRDRKNGVDLGDIKSMKEDAL